MKNVSYDLKQLRMNDSDSESERKLSKSKANTIKAQSPFTKHYSDIMEKVKSELSQQSNDDSLETNDYHEPRYIDLLMDKYMPYAFLWSFTSRGTGLSRITNGCLESYNGFKKRKATKNRLPHRYIRDSFEAIDGQAIEYLETIQTKTSFKRRIDSDNEYEGDKKHKCTENYDKRRKNSFEPPKQNSMGYQKKVDIEAVTKKPS